MLFDIKASNSYHGPMRTTLTIDPDVAAELDRLHGKGGMNLRQLVNHALRLGLQEISSSPTSREPFKTRSFDLGKPLIDNIDCAGEMLAMDDEEFFKRLMNGD
jgi:hypothetical protein